MKRFTMDLNGPLHGLDFGGEGRLVMLVHGIGGSSINWAAIGPELTTHGRVIAPDLPGFGRTPPAGRSTRIDDQAQLVAELIERETDEPALVIGNSMGGLISMLLAARKPHLVERLVLLNPAAPSLKPSTINGQWAVMMAVYLMPGFNRALFESLQKRGDAESRTAEAMDVIAASGDRVPDWLQRMHADVAREREQMPWVASSYLEAYRSIISRIMPPAKYNRLVHRIMAPTLLVHGDIDGIVPYDAARRLAQQRPDWTFVTLEDTGHVPQLEAVETTVKLIHEFVGQPHEV